MIEPFSEFDRWFDTPSNFRSMANFTPAVDVWEDEDNVYVETSLPGIDPENVNISIENDILTIEGGSEKKTEVDEKNYYRKEVRYGSFHRSVALPTSVKNDAATANHENGILKVTLPKEEKVKPQKIKVQIKK